MPYLEIKLGSDTMLLRFGGRVDYVFGRLPGADVQLRDMKVSRVHSQLFVDSRGDAFVRDLGSSTGTFVGPRRLRKGAIARLKDGDALKIGGARVIFRGSDAPSKAVAPPGRSTPGGLIRTNERERPPQGAAAPGGSAADPAAGPAEPPPAVDVAKFSGEGAAPKPGRDAGIVETPWDQRAEEPAIRADKPGPLATPRQDDVPPSMPSADYDETGRVVPPDPPPPTVIEDTGESQLLPEIADELQDEPPSDAGDAFRRPGNFQGAPPGDPEDESPKLGMPTVRIDKSTFDERRTEEDTKPEKSRIPTTRLDKVSAEERRLREAEEEEPEPEIGRPIDAHEAAAKKFGWEAGDDDWPASGDVGPDAVEVLEAHREFPDTADEDRDDIASEAWGADMDDSDFGDDGEASQSRRGASPDREFKRRKTRKLMKTRPDTGRVTDKTPDTPPPTGDETAAVRDDEIPRGEDTVFVPKPGEDRDEGKNETGDEDEDVKERDRRGASDFMSEGDDVPPKRGVGDDTIVE